jgi:hypothetical protein
LQVQWLFDLSEETVSPDFFLPQASGRQMLLSETGKTNGEREGPYVIKASEDASMLEVEVRITASLLYVKT